jgi:hypothetical protein
MIGLQEIFFSFFALGYLALIAFVLMLGVRFVRAVERIADRMGG